MSSANALRWDGGPGHYEVHYVTLTDPASGIGVWVRYTLLAPRRAPRPRDRAQHAGRRAVPRRRLAATDPVALVRARSRFGLTTWRFEAREGKRRVAAEVDAPRETLAGVTYHDPDGRPAYCYNSEVASIRLSVFDRTARGRFGWVLRDTLVAHGRAHFEYGQRASVPGVELLLP
jgi:hypothetical protein